MHINKNKKIIATSGEDYTISILKYYDLLDNDKSNFISFYLIQI